MLPMHSLYRADTAAAACILSDLRHVFFTQCEIFLTHTAGTRIRMAAGRNAVSPHCVPGQQTTERQKEICMAKKAKKADKKAPKKGK